jgi:co-chaperonin GroES (HSP10)
MALYSMKMTGNNVLLSPCNQPEATKLGIVIPQRYQRTDKTYKVLSVGPGRWVRKKGKPAVLIAPDVQPGDTVLSEMYLGHRGVVEDGHGRIVCDVDQLIAIVKYETRS